MNAVVDPEICAGLLVHFARYFNACDRADIDEVMQVMDGATVRTGAHVLSDPAMIREIYEMHQPKPLDKVRRATKHHITNLLVDGPDADGVYTAAACNFRLEPGASDPQLTASGRLSQTVRRDGDRWQVLGHSIVTDS